MTATQPVSRATLALEEPDLEVIREVAASTAGGRRGTPGRVGLGLVLLAVVVGGVCLTSAAYSMGRLHLGTAPVLFWVGQIVAFTATLLGALSRQLGKANRRLLLWAYALGQSVVVAAYSPLTYRFPDELQHWRTAEDILTTGHLFHANPSLPVSPEFPGLEILTTFLVRTCGLSTFTAGRVVSTISHLLLALAVFALLKLIAKDENVAAVGTLIYLTLPVNIMFNGLWVYGGVAVPFLWFALERLSARGGRSAWLRAAAAAAAFGVITVTHPSTLLFGLVALWGMVLVALVIRRDDVLRWSTVAIVSTGLAALWIDLRAPDVLGYLGRPMVQIRNAFFPEVGQGATKQVLAAPRPRIESLLAAGSVILTALAILVAAWIVLVRDRRSYPRSARLSVCAAFAFFPLLFVRVATPDGAEYYTRTLTYVGLFMALCVAIVCVRYFRTAFGRAVVVAAAVLMFCGNVATGWPPFWERLPGSQYVAGFEAGISGQAVQLSDWASANASDSRVACDLVACGWLAAHSSIDPVRDAGAAYFAPAFDSRTIDILRGLNVTYVVVDRRMATEPPVTGTYFAVLEDALDRGKPVGEAGLRKFEDDPRIEKEFDNGRYAVYYVRGLWQ